MSGRRATQGVSATRASWWRGHASSISQGWLRYGACTSAQPPMTPHRVFALALAALSALGCGQDAATGPDAAPHPDSSVDASSDGDGGTGLPDGAPGSSALCGLQSWTWENPLPQGNALPSVFGFSRTNAWAVGSHGTILHWNGTAWSCVAAPTQRFLNAVWGSAPDDLWAVGGDASAGIILHGDGTSWSIASTPTFTLSGVWGSGPRDVWAVGP